MTGSSRLRLPLSALSLAVLAAAIGWIVTASTEATTLIAVMTVLVMVALPTNGGIRYSLSLSALVAAPLVLLDQNYELQLRTTIVVLGLGIVTSHALMILSGADDGQNLASLIRRLMAAGAFLGVFVILLGATLGRTGQEPEGALTLSISLAAFAWFLTDTATWALATHVKSHQSWGHYFSLAIQAWPIAASVLATGVFFGIAFTSTFWWWALPVSLLPYAFAHIAFHRAHETRRTYRQTIRALSRIPEVSALSPDGHGDRTAVLALDIASQLGMQPKDLQELEYAAQMHDIGRITLNQPSILRMGFTDEDIARWGAEMVAEVSYLNNVSELVLKQHEPYRRPGEQKDPELPMGSKIIKAASAYDHATTELGFMPVEALEVLHRGAAYDYDPDVVGAIRAVLERDEVVS